MLTIAYTLLVAVPIPKSEPVLDSKGENEARFPVSVPMAARDQVSEPAVER